jgi:hypothetical protein
MKHTTAYNHKTRALSAIDSLFACARISGIPANDLIESYKVIMADHVKLPRYMREYLRGVFDEKWKQLYKDSLVFGGFFDGKFYTTHSNHDRYYQKHGFTPMAWAEHVAGGMVSIGHYYTTTQRYKPFSDVD